MIGPMSSSLSLAQRTASKARATMDDMSRQIATGQKVSSVKDDGAAWARAAALTASKVDHEARIFALDRVDAGLAAQRAVNDARMEVLEELKGLLLSARSHNPGSTARVQLAAPWATLVTTGLSFQPNNPVFANMTGYGSDASGTGVRMTGTGDPLLGGERWAIEPSASNWMLGGLDIFNITTATTTELDDMIAEVQVYLGHSGSGWATDWGQQIGADERTSAWMRDYSNSALDRIDTAIGSLTDADMGKASTARANAETRQQLALSTIQQAISAYGNFASGLLGNVQRTQRGLLA
jgi:flagellin